MYWAKHCNRDTGIRISLRNSMLGDGVPTQGALTREERLSQFASFLDFFHPHSWSCNSSIGKAKKDWRLLPCFDQNSKQVYFLQISFYILFFFLIWMDVPIRMRRLRRYSGNIVLYFDPRSFSQRPKFW